MKRKYQKVTGWWTYGHIVVPEKLIYIGYGGGKNGDEQCYKRWKPSAYKTTELYPYIEKHGWDNIEHIVFKDGLTKKQAEVLEDLLITQAKIDGWCINKQSSGGYWRDNPVEYRKQYNEEHMEHRKQYREDHKEYYKQYDKQHYQEHKEEKKQYNKQHYQNHKEERKQYREDHREELNNKQKEYYKNHPTERKEYAKKLRSTPEGKIYYRVTNFNRYHPDRMIETPLEAKNKYLEWGYIPDYIKNDDLI